ncbi:MAG: beta-glucosidase [Chloroflexi bacterium]|nr:beta-glucosidase [Chloroflexota bacterium]
MAAETQAVEAQIDCLLAQMTLAEKVGQMCQLQITLDDLEDRIRAGHAGSIILSGAPVPGASPQEPVVGPHLNHLQRIAVEETRLGIPILFGRDVLHGYKTVAPIPLGMAASWSPDVVEAACRVAAREASADGIRWVFAPMLDIARDPRWGRIAEGFGEDPFLCSALARAAVRGFQGDDLTDPEAVLACAKHYAGYGAAEGGRDYNGTEITPSTLHNVYLPSFHAAVQAGVGSIMTGFPENGGVPITANRHLVTEILKDEWGFDGLVISDWAAIDELRYHGVAADRAGAARLAALAGIDMDLAAEVYVEELAGLVESGALPEAVIDEAVRRILRAKLRLGLFAQPYTETERAAVHLHADHRQIVRDAAARSLVLLKNDGILPLAKAGQTIGVFGPLAEARATLFGSWTLDGHEDSVVSILDRVRETVDSAAQIRTSELADDALWQARHCDVVIAVVGEAVSRSGEDNCITTLDLPPGQTAFLEALFALQVPVIVVVLAGRPLALESIHRQAAAVLMAWHPGTEGGRAVADVLFGDANPSGKLPVTFPRTVGQVPLYYNHRPTGRPLPPRDRRHSRYVDQLDSPLYPFGYGLSYTEFAYNNLRIVPAGPQAVMVSAEITNTGTRAGEEIVQLYVRDRVASLSRPVKELKGFARLALAPGETQTVTFELTEQELSFYDTEGCRVFEPGEFDVWVGPDSTGGLAGQFVIAPA